jgi:hypothetical protein
MLEAHAKREAAELSSKVKNAMITGLWANPNYDDNKQTRRRAIEDIESSHREVIRVLYGKIDSQEDITKTHPFFTMAESDVIPEPHDPEVLKKISELDQM